MAVPTVANWKAILAKQIGVRLTPQVSQFFDDWSRAEGGDANNNPFNTTQPAPGAGDYNSVGVKHYISPMQGITATAQTLKNGRYGNILGALAQGTDPMAMAKALEASPWGTGSLVVKMLGGQATPTSISGAGVNEMPTTGGGLAQAKVSPLPGVSTLPQLMQMGAPSDTSVNILGKLGGIAGQTAKAAQASIPLPTPLQGTTNVQQPVASAAAGATPQQDPYAINAIPHQSSIAGQVPMVTGGDIRQKYPNLAANSNVDWQHVNPRLLQVINDAAAKRGTIAVLNSGYRSDQYSPTVGGFKGDPHTQGVAVDAYINGHPIADVIPPEEWAKAGVRSGNTPGFFKGKPDPEHLDLVGIPVKGGK